MNDQVSSLFTGPSNTVADASDQHASMLRRLPTSEFRVPADYDFIDVSVYCKTPVLVLLYSGSLQYDGCEITIAFDDEMDLEELKNRAVAEAGRGQRHLKVSHLVGVVSARRGKAG